MAARVRSGRAGKGRAKPAWLAGLVVLLLLAGGLLWLFGGAAERGTAERGTAEIGGAFRLVSDSGAVVTGRSFPGKYLLIYFGYTSCPDVCPTTLADIAVALTRLGKRAARVQTLFISVDPARDTPAVLGKYLARFSPAIIGLTGSQSEIGVVEKEFRVSVAVVPGKDGGYSVDHTAALYLMAPDGRFVTALRADEGGDALAAEIGKIVSRDGEAAAGPLSPRAGRQPADRA